MLIHARKFFVLFSSVAILLIGHGLQLTLLPLRAEQLGWSATEIGMTGSFYFLGFLVGCVLVPRFVGTVGHVRTFSTTTTLCGAALLLVLLSNNPLVWSGLRFITGVGISGCYLIIESWLNEQSSDEQRGQTLAIYTMIVLTAMSFGQLLVVVDAPTSVLPVVIGSLLLSCAIMPVSLSRLQLPSAITAPEFAFKRIYRAAPAGVGSAFAIGTVSSVLFTLTPVFATRAGLSLSEVSVMMIAMFIGGAALQIPAGRLSDRMDRRRVIAGLLTLGLLVCLLALFAPPWPLLSMVVLFLLGGVGTAVYPLSLAHANDRLPGHFLQVGTVILLVNSAGAVFGPTFGATFMDLLGERGLFVYMAVGFLITLGWIAFCIQRRNEAPEHAEPFIAAVKSTQGTLEMDPRTQHTETEGHHPDKEQQYPPP